MATALKPAQSAKLRDISTLTALLGYLHEELDWPLDLENIDDAYFDYDPDEIGLDAENSAKIKSIKQLRPLSNKQPWGIFFVEFNNKQLPVVALRRILRGLVVKSRNTGADRQRWKTKDLLFVSAYGEAGDRQITFAHFTDESEYGDLPILRVLGWDAADTGLQLSQVAHTLHEKLHWPADGIDIESWRSQWAAAFRLKPNQVINDSKSLAVLLAQLAARIRDRAVAVLAIESAKGPLRSLEKAFKESLISDLDDIKFADMYAQTITYGLFAARVSRASGALVADDVSLVVPSTNPFLKELLESFLDASGRVRSKERRIDFDELGINDVVEALRESPMDAILAQFGNARPDDDPVIHFYEDFLKAYDRKLKAERGVFYTPRPVVQFIVRSVHEILQKEFGLDDGLASTATWADMREKFRNDGRNLALPAGVTENMPFIHILDPATGTATFLVEVIDVVYSTLKAKWRASGAKQDEINRRWNEYVPAHLLPRLYGFELMMAPYAIAHMKIGLKLGETGYKFPENTPRVNVFLTNALEPAQAIQAELVELAPMLAHEAEAASKAKSSLPATVVIGNPPYSGLSKNMNPWIDGLLKGELPSRVKVKSYYQVDGRPLGERKLWLQDDYVKFFRLAQWRIESCGIGVLGYITNHGFLDNPTFRGMRQCLMSTFGLIDVVDLHGNSKKKERTPDGHKDVNVFDIEQGVAISIMRSGLGAESPRFGEIWGPRVVKYEALLSTAIVLSKLEPVSPYYFLAPRNNEWRAEFNASWPLNAVFPVNATGVVTARDHFVVALDSATLTMRMKEFVAEEFSDEAIRKKYFSGMGAAKYVDGDTRSWKLGAARVALRAENWSAAITDFLYRPFDTRKLIYTPVMVDWPRTEVMKHMLNGSNIGLSTVRQLANTPWEHVSVSGLVHDDCYVSNRTKERTYCFPLWLYSGNERHDLYEDDLLSELPGRRANLAQKFVQALLDALELRLSDWRAEEASAPLHAEKIFHYVFAILYSPAYRARYVEFLKSEFARIPLPGSLELFDAISVQGAALVSLHKMEAPQLISIAADVVSAATDASPSEVAIAPIFFGKSRQLLKVAEGKRSLANLATDENGVTRGTVYINAESGFVGVSKAVWEFSIGAYQVLHKWLDDRRKAGRSLSDDDIAHWRRIHAALEQTMATMDAIDVIINEAGGFPDAFANIPPPAELPVPVAEEDDSQPEPKPRGKRKSKVDVTISSLFEGLEPIPTPASKPLQVRAAAKRQVKANEISANDAMAAFRECLANGQLARGELIRDAAHALGVERAGKLIKEVLDGHLRAAVRRRIVTNERGMIRLAGRTIEDFERSELKGQFVAALVAEGQGWVERADAIRAFARWLGFTRTGEKIEAKANSLINGLLREGRLEAQGKAVRKAR